MSRQVCLQLNKYIYFDQDKQYSVVTKPRLNHKVFFFFTLIPTIENSYNPHDLNDPLVIKRYQSLGN